MPIEAPQEPAQQNVTEGVTVTEEYGDEEETEVTLEDTGLTAVALYDYQAAADDEISFDPDDVITHVEMVNIPSSAPSFVTCIITCHCFNRSTKAGGEDCARISTACSRPITCNCSNRDNPTVLSDRYRPTESTATYEYIDYIF